MARYQGKDLIVRWIDASGTVTISGDRRVLDVEEEVEEKDTTAGNDAARNYAPLHLLLGASMTSLYAGTAGTAVLYRLRAGAAGTLLFGPLGTAAGLPKGGFAAFVKSQPMSIPYDDNIEVTVDFMPTSPDGWAFDPRVDVWP